MNLLGVTAFKTYTKYKDDKENRRATIIPFSALTGYLKGAADAVRVINQFSSLTLPKTAEEYVEFVKKIGSITAPLSSLGVHVMEDTVSLLDTPTPTKNSIETLGYGVSSLSIIAELSDQANKGLDSLKSINFASLDQQYVSAKDEEKKYIKRGVALVKDVVHMTSVRITFVIGITKSTVSAISRYYKQNDVP